MSFDDDFKKHLFKGGMDHLSISFLVNKRESHYGGCAANISYSLALFSIEPYLLSSVGMDFPKYQKWLNGSGVSTDFVVSDPNDFTAAAYILSDKEHNQITMFSPSASGNKDLNYDLDSIDLDDFSCAIISPDVPKRMIDCYEYFKKHNFPYYFDPGQALPVLDKDELVSMTVGSQGVFLNSYEASLLVDKTGLSLQDLSMKVRFVVRTLGKDGVELWVDGKMEVFPAVKVSNIVDSTGCGDAFRAGFLYGLLYDNNLEKACMMGNIAAVYALENLGTQNHSFSLAEFNERFISEYGLAP